ncbi:hypothetical protein AB0C18_27330 [Nonomuraea muscovyensis]|jgi:hypothetical protein|uniref:hypothetical protein n=1 Tax=Nonomuraea muscovyensis TaxID=1124761 RepID=UPI00340834C1|nr:hypothetical protein [Nonomuraea muscovyensis]
MNDRARVALALAAGYYLGRRHKLRLATMLAAAGVARNLRKGDSGGLLKHGIKLLGQSPQMEEMTNRLRGELMEVGKAAAVAATSRQLETLTSRLHERAESLRQPGEPEGGRARDEEDEYDEESAYDEEEPEEEPEEEKPKPRARSTKSTKSTAGTKSAASADKPVTRTRRPTAGTSRARR